MKSITGRWVVWALALVTSMGGAYVSWDLTVNHGKVPKAKTAESQPATQPAASWLSQMCGSFTWSNCEEAAESPWAVFPFGWGNKALLRTSSLGLAFFVGMICWLIIVGWPTASRWWVQMLPLLATGVGLGVSIRLEHVMWTQFTKKCPLCILSHVATLVLFVLLILLWPREEEEERPAKTAPIPPQADEPGMVTAGRVLVTRQVWPKWWTLMTTLVIAAVAITTTVTFAEGWSLVRAAMARVNGGAAATQPVQAVKDYYEQQLKRYETRPEHAYVAWQLAPKLNIPIAGRPVKGPADARHTVVIFSDFECPACQRYEEILAKKIVPLFGLPETGGVRMVFKHWPLCTECNKAAETDRHPVACVAAYAAEAAFVLGGDAAFWKMHDLLFERQEDWKESKDFAKLAKQIGLNEDAFVRTMNSPEVRARVVADADDGANLGMDLVEKGELTAEDRKLQKINSTPTIYVDGKLLHPPHQEYAWRRILTASAAETQAADQSARIASLEQRLSKAAEDMQAMRKRYGYYNTDLAAHAVLSWQLAPTLNIPMQGRPAKGPDTARHAVVVYGDFGDNSAGMFQFWLTQMILPKGADPAVGGIRVIFKQWPMDADNNPYAKTAQPVSWKAACASEAAYVLGGDAAFWKMHDLLINPQMGDWKKTLDFTAFAQQAGLDPAKFTETMNSEPVKARIKADIEEGAALGKDLVAQGAIKEDRREWIKAESAPAVFVDGKRLYMFGQMATWDKILGYVAKPRTGSVMQPPGPGSVMQQPTPGSIMQQPVPATAPAP